jgi:hypothetical protein
LRLKFPLRMPMSFEGVSTMAVKDGDDSKKKGVLQQAGGYKIRTTNDLLLVSMILDGDPPLRERVLHYLEQQLGKRSLLKVGEDPG